MDTVLLPLMRSHKLPQYIQELQQAFAEEAIARKNFREWLTPEIKAEFINGEVIVHSPARYRHNDAQLLIARLLSVHVDSRNLGKVQGEKALIELSRNDYKPDVCFWRNKKSFHFEPDQMAFPPPDLIVEVLSPSTAEVDRGAKFRDYATHGVQEYWIVDPVEREVEQHVLNDGVYQLQAKLARHDTIQSVIVDDFEVSVFTFFDAAENLVALARMIKI